MTQDLPPRRGETPERRREILDAALAVLAEHGWQGATMLRIAQRARASKETLYAWFGDRAGLFAALIAANAEAVGAELARAAPGGAPERRLARLAEALLRLLLGDAAVELNRAAIAEAPRDPALADLLSRHGRDTFAPRIAALLGALRQEGVIAFAEEEDAVGGFLGLVLGDLQVGRLLGRLPAPAEAEITARARGAARRFLAAYAA